MSSVRFSASGKRELGLTLNAEQQTAAQSPTKAGDAGRISIG